MTIESTTDQPRGDNEMTMEPGFRFSNVSILSARNGASPSDCDGYAQNQPMGSWQVFEFEPLNHFEALELQLKTLGKRQSRILIEIWRKEYSDPPHLVSW
jgi:hypothetical protein